jgi:hypothetical protein
VRRATVVILPALLAVLAMVGPGRGATTGAEVPRVDVVTEAEWGVEIRVTFPPWESVLERSGEGAPLARSSVMSLGLDPRGRPVPRMQVVLAAPGERGNRLQVVETRRTRIPGLEIPAALGPGSGLFPPGEPSAQEGSPAWVSYGGRFRGRDLLHVHLSPLEIPPRGEATWLESIRLRVSWGRPAPAIDRPGEGETRAGTGVGSFPRSLWDRVVENPRTARALAPDRDRAGAHSPAAPAQGSFSQGDGWIRIEVDSTALFVLTSGVLSQLIPNLDTIDPRSFRLLSSGGRQQPSDLRRTPASWEASWEMTEHALWVSGEQDGRFDSGDTLAFWGVAPEEWADYTDPASPDSLFQSHDWDDVSVYWLTWGGSFPAPARRMAFRTTGPPGAGSPVATHRARLHRERDLLVSLNGADDGYAWQFLEGETPATNGYSFRPLHSVPGSPVTIRTRLDAVYSNANRDHRVLYSLNGEALTDSALEWRPREHPRLEDHPIFTLTGDSVRAGSNLFSITVLRDLDGNDGIIFSWFDVHYDSRLEATGGVLDFFAPGGSGPETYRLDGFDSAQEVLLFDVTDHADPVRLGSFAPSSGRVSYQDAMDAGGRHYLAAARGALASLSFRNARRVNAPADLRDLNDGYDMLILAPGSFRAAADRLAAYRRNNLPGVAAPRVLVADLEDVFANFSGGMVDPNGIRNFVKYLYDRFQTGGEARLQFVTLIGDATYDFKNVSGRGFNFVPVYLDLNPKTFKEEAIISDDWFVKMDPVDFDEEHDLPDLAVGRILARSSSQAMEMVNRIIAYEDPANLGTWRARAILSCDDETTNPGDFFFIRDTENLGNRYLPAAMDKVKVYLTDYELRGGAKPGATEDFMDAWKDGAVFLSYMGHGGPEQMADERLLYISDVPGLRNGKRLPLVITLSCTIARFDDPFLTSMGEALLSNPDGGAITMVGATRLTFHVPNAALGEEFLNQMFPGPFGGKTLEEGILPPAWALALAKEVEGTALSRIENNEKYFYLGDAAGRLVVPELGVRFLGGTSDSLVAAGPVTVEGEVVRDGSRETGFDGTVNLRVWDSEERRTVSSSGVTVPYYLPGARIFEGTARVEDGFFRSSFYVPLKPRFGDEGRIRAYVFENDRDGVGATDSVVIQRRTGEPQENEGGPEIRLFFENYARSVKTGARLFAELSDPQGISILGSLGQNSILLEFDNDGLPRNITERFQYDSGSFTRGALEYPLPTGLDVGTHTAVLTASDNLGVSSKDTLSFTLIEEARFEVTQVINYPNPFRDRTVFSYQLSDAADVEVRIYTSTGRMVRRLEGRGNRGMNVLPWDGRDERGDAVANGVYLYRLSVRYRGQNTAPDEVLGTVLRIR